MKDYNFFSRYITKKGFQFNPQSPYFIGAIIVLLCIALSVGVTVRNLIITSNINTSEEALNVIKSSNDYIAANKLQQSLDAMAEYESSADIALSNFQSANILNAKLLTDLFKGLPSNSTVIFLNVEGLNIQMTMNIPERKTAAELLLGLKETKILQDVQLETIEQNRESTGFIARVHGVLKAGEQD